MSAECLSSQALSWKWIGNDHRDWVVIDIETGQSPDAEIAQRLEEWKPPGNCTKAETIAAKKAAAESEMKEKSALWDSAPILCIALVTRHTNVLINAMDDQEHTIKGWHVCSVKNERSALIALREWLQMSDLETPMIVGHHVMGFDLPKIRSAYMRHRLRMPTEIAVMTNAVEDAAEVCDTMRMYSGRFSSEAGGSPFVSLDRMARGLGVSSPKAHMTGADVPRFHRMGRHKEILTYCALDASTTAICWQLMSGESLELQ